MHPEVRAARQLFREDRCTVCGELVPDGSGLLDLMLPARAHYPNCVAQIMTHLVDRTRSVRGRNRSRVEVLRALHVVDLVVLR